MKRFLNPALVAIAACATFGLAACGTTAAADATVTGDTATGTDDAAISDSVNNGDAATTTTDTKGGDADVASDTGPKCPTCKSGETCDTTTFKCVALPCGGACKATEKCGKDDKCYTPCDGKCTGTQVCDTTTPPGTCKDLTQKWGINDDGKVQKVTSLAIAAAADGCDLNGDGKPDNKLNALASMAGSALSDSIKKGTVVLLFEPKSYKTDGTAFTFNVLIGDQDPADKTAGVDVTAAGGKYTVQTVSYDTATGKPLVVFTDAKITAGALTAAATSFYLNLSIQSINIALTISKPTLSGTVTDSNSWVDTKAGKLCGYITKSDLEGAINALPDDTFKNLGMTKAQVLQLLPSVLAPDLDMDGDGKKESISLALNLETKAGIITGMSKK